MTKRSERLVEKCLAKADKFHAELANITPLPQPDEFGYVKLRYQELRRLIDERHKLAWADGVFYAFAAFGPQEPS